MFREVPQLYLALWFSCQPHLPEPALKEKNRAHPDSLSTLGGWNQGPRAGPSHGRPGVSSVFLSVKGTQAAAVHQLTTYLHQVAGAGVPAASSLPGRGVLCVWGSPSGISRGILPSEPWPRGPQEAPAACL